MHTPDGSPSITERISHLEGRCAGWMVATRRLLTLSSALSDREARGQVLACVSELVALMSEAQQTLQRYEHEARSTGRADPA